MLENRNEIRKKKKLWIITELYYPENNQTGYYMTGIGEGLAEVCDVKVICGQPNYAVRGVIAPKREIHNNVEIFRVKGTTLDKNIVFYRLINMLTHGFSVFFKALSEIKKNDEILTVSAPPSLPFLSALAAKIKGAEYSVIVQDKYPETLLAVKKLKPDTLLMKLFTRLNGWLYNNAKKIIVVGRDMSELVAGQLNSFERSKQKIDVIQNWAALEEIEPQPKSDNKILNNNGLADKFIFLYAGNMGHPQDIESILICAEKLSQHKYIRFLFIGSGVKRNRIERHISEKKLTNVILLEPQPRQNQTDFLNACDIGFVTLVRGMSGVAMPSRTYNFLAAGKPILALTENGTEVERVISENNVGWTVETESPEKLLEKILEVFENRENLKEISENARNVALLHFNSSIAVNKYRRIFSNASDNEIAFKYKNEFGENK